MLKIPKNGLCIILPAKKYANAFDKLEPILKDRYGLLCLTGYMNYSDFYCVNVSLNIVGVYTLSTIPYDNHKKIPSWLFLLYHKIYSMFVPMPYRVIVPSKVDVVLEYENNKGISQ